MRLRRVIGVVVLLAASVLGCGSTGTAPTAPASGTLLFNGQPAQAARVIFTPKSGRPASGNTDDQGRFVLTTFESEDGAVPGEHTVTVSDLERNWNQDPSRSRFPTPYERPDTTPLVVEIKPEDENSFTFDMKN